MPWPKFFTRQAQGPQTPFYLAGRDYLQISSGLESTVETCVKLYENAVRELPLRVEKNGIYDPLHPLNALLISPSSQLDRAQLFSRAIRNILLEGRAIFLIHGAPPDRLSLVWRAEDCTISLQQGELYFRLNNMLLKNEDVLYCREASGEIDNPVSRLEGLKQALKSVNDKISVLAQSAFQSKVMIKGLPKSQKTEKIKKFQDDLREFITSNKPQDVLTLEGATELAEHSPDYGQETFPAFWAQIRAAVFALFHVPPLLAGGLSAKTFPYKGQTESLNLWARTGLAPTLALIENQITEKLLDYKSKMNGYKAAFDLSALTRGDAHTEAQSLMLLGGQRPALTANEIRERLHLPAREDGNSLEGGGNES